MSSELINSVVEILLPVLATILTTVCSWIGLKIKKLYEEKVNTETKRQVVELTVKYIEQVYQDLHGKDKLKKALETATEWLNTKGLQVTEAELTILIEAAVHNLNLEGIFIETDDIKTLNE